MSHVTFGELQTAPCTAPCTLPLPRLSCIATSHCGTPRRSVLRIQPPTLQIPVRHHLRTLRWCECEGCGLVASISTIITTTPHHLVPSRLLSPAWALSPGSQHRDLGQNDLPSAYHDNCPQSLDDCTSIQSKLENPSAQCAAECRLNPPAVDIVGECECTAPAPLPPCCQL